jgi:hypothetical protein
MRIPRKKTDSSRRFKLSPSPTGGPSWKNPEVLERSELSDFSFEPLSLSTTGSTNFSWDVSTDFSDGELKILKQKHLALGVSPKQAAASGESLKTVSISKTVATDNTSGDDREVTEKPPSPATTPSNTSGTVFAFLEALFCCGLDTTDSPKKQDRQKDMENTFLGKIITCQINTCDCEGCTGCVKSPEDNSVDAVVDDDINGCE